MRSVRVRRVGHFKPNRFEGVPYGHSAIEQPRDVHLANRSRPAVFEDVPHRPHEDLQGKRVKHNPSGLGYIATKPSTERTGSVYIRDWIWASVEAQPHEFFQAECRVVSGSTGD